MYKALKLAQNEIQEALLKFVDEAAQGQNAVCRCSNAATNATVYCAASRGNACQCALVTQSVPVAPLVPSSVAAPSSCQCAATCVPRLEVIERTLQYIVDKQDAQYEILVGGIQDLNMSLKLLIQQTTVETSTTIPNLAPQSQGSDLKNVSVATSVATSVAMAMAAPEPTSVAVAAPEDAEEAEAEEEAEEEEQAEEAEVDAEEAEAEVAEEQAEPDIEVEEWTYKGRLFFKDSENTVYANNAGEIGDPIGQYDPSKNIVKKLPTN